MKNKKLIILLITFVVIVAVAVVGYNYLSENYEPETVTPPEDEREDLVKVIDFTMQNRNGETVNLSDFSGKPIVMNFWATWCGPCKSELPAFENMYQEYGDKVNFLMVNMTDGYSETVEKCNDYIKEQRYTFPVYCDTNQDAAYKYGVNSIPMTFFIDEELNVMGYYPGAMTQNTLKYYTEQLIK